LINDAANIVGFKYGGGELHFESWLWGIKKRL
jgi:hypothetical protein